MIVSKNDTLRTLDSVLPRPDLSTAIALVQGQLRLNYGDLDRSVDFVAARFLDMGVSPGDRVAVMLRNNVSLVASLFAAWKLGVSVVPVSVHSRRQEVRNSISEFGVTVAVVAEDLATKVQDSIGTNTCCRVVSEVALEGLPQTTNETTLPGSIADPDAIALYQFSSGTTGTSKMIGRSHRQLLREAELVVEATGLSRNDTVLAVAPLHHAYGLTDALLAPLVAGSAIVLSEEFRPDETAALIRRERITVFPGVPYMFGVLADALREKPAELPSLRLCLSAGAPLEREIFCKFQARYGTPIRQQYGATELGAVAINRTTDPAALWQSVGRPLSGVDVEIWNEAGKRMSTDTVGEVVVRSPVQTSGYVGASREVTAERFRDGWFLTGDLGRIDRDGNLFVVGRKNTLINTPTHKVDPFEVEKVLMSHEAVTEAVVLGAPGRYGSEIVKAVVVARRPVAPAEIRAHCRGQIADYKIPVVVEVVDAIPRSAMGKVQRKYLVGDPAEGEDLDDSMKKPSECELRGRLVTILCEALGIEDLDSQAGFYELGGDSLKGIEIAVAIKKALGVDVPPASLHANWTLDTLARTIHNLLGDPAVSHLHRSSELSVDSLGSISVPTDGQQRELWDHLQAMPVPDRSCANVGTVVRISGALVPNRLRAAFSEVVQRHEALRARFPTNGCVMIDARKELDIGIVDASTFHDRRVRRVASSLWDRPFDHVKGPLCRLFALIQGSDRWVLALVISHLVADISSVTILLDELVGAYAGVGRAAPKAYPPQISNYLSWLVDCCATERGRADAAYWSALLANAASLGETTQRLRGAAFVTLDVQSIERLRAANRARGVTLFEALLAAYVAVLHLHTGKTDILVGSPYSMRREPFQRTVGWLTKTVYFRVGVSRTSTLSSVLNDIRQSVRDGFAHALASQTPPRESRATYAMFALDNVRTAQIDLSGMALPLVSDAKARLHGLEVEAFPISPRPSAIDCLPQFAVRLMSLVSDRNELRAVIAADPGIFDTEALRRTAERYAILLNRLIEMPDAPLSNI